MRLTSIVLQVVMHRVLNVAEKNDAAKSLARLLSKNSASMVKTSSRCYCAAHISLLFSVRVFQNLIKFTSLIISYLTNRCK